MPPPAIPLQKEAPEATEPEEAAADVRGKGVSQATARSAEVFSLLLGKNAEEKTTPEPLCSSLIGDSVFWVLGFV